MRGGVESLKGEDKIISVMADGDRDKEVLQSSGQVGMS